MGEPGSRTFYLQAQHQAGSLVSILIEKTQAFALADQIDDLLKEIAGQSTPDSLTTFDAITASRFALLAQQTADAET